MLYLSSVPTFWLDWVFLLIFSVWLGWFPDRFFHSGRVTSANVTIFEKIYHLILPAFTLSLMSFSNIALHTRQKLIDVWNSEYVLFAQARGEGDWTILRRHGFRNILLPALTLQFASFAELFGGSVMAENVFRLSRLGSAVSAAGLNGGRAFASRDYVVFRFICLCRKYDREPSLWCRRSTDPGGERVMKWNRRTKVVMLTALMAGIVIAIYLFGTMIPKMRSPEVF